MWIVITRLIPARTCAQLAWERDSKLGIHLISYILHVGLYFDYIGTVLYLPAPISPVSRDGFSIFVPILRQSYDGFGPEKISS